MSRRTRARGAATGAVRTDPLRALTSLLTRPQWIVVITLLVAASGLFVSEISLSAATSLEPQVLRREPFIALPTNIALLLGIVVVNLLLGSRVTTHTRIFDRQAVIMRFLPYVSGIVTGIVALEALDIASGDDMLRTVEESFSPTSLPFVLALQAGVLLSVFVGANYVSAATQVIVSLRDESARQETRVRELNGLLEDAHRASLREVAEHLHGEVQGRLIHLAHRVTTRGGPGLDLDEVARELTDISDGIIRPLSHRLYPAEIAVSLGVALEKLCDGIARYRPTPRFVERQLATDSRPLPFEMREAIYHVVREAVNNAIKHGTPGSIEVSIDQDDDAVALTVSNIDREGGPDADLRQVEPLSFGMRRIDSEIERRGGTWSLLRRNGTVTFTVRLGVPHG